MTYGDEKKQKNKTFGFLYLEVLVLFKTDSKLGRPLALTTKKFSA